MPSTQEFRRRIKSVNSTRQITKAMEMIASIKMQKSVKTAASTRSYTQNAWNMLETLAKLTSSEDHPLLAEMSKGRCAVILVTSDKGLAGSYNAEVIKKYSSFVKNSTSEIDVIAVGKKGAEFVKRYGIGNLNAEFNGFDSNIDFEKIVPIAKLSIDEFLNGTYNEVIVVYSHFVSSLKQIAVTKQILPIKSDHIDNPDLWEQEDKQRDITEVKFEPDADQVLEQILPQFVRAQIYGAILESNASEHSARMVAMKNATDNAKDLIDELQLVYNSVRQDSITREIAEISGAAEAMK